MCTWRPKLIVLQPTSWCNIDCQYCYLPDRRRRSGMSQDVVAAVADKILRRVARDATPTIVWHSGEPTTVPLAWYREAYSHLKPAAPANAIFSIQTNGVSLPDRWIDFLIETGTRIGLSIDGPQRFHDRKRKTKGGAGTWSMAVDTLRRLQAAGLTPHVISVLHPDCLSAADEFYEFYRSHNLTDVLFSIDEVLVANGKSSFDGLADKARMTSFLARLMTRAFEEQYPLRIRDIERTAAILSGHSALENEQLDPWQVVVVGANGDLTTFSPEFLGLRSELYDDFRFGNILDTFDPGAELPALARVHADIRKGIEACGACDYFRVCGGGAPANKLSENGSLSSSDTQFCKLSIQCSHDALTEFLRSVASVRSTNSKNVQRSTPADGRQPAGGLYATVSLPN
jgi:uncharacterized protein